ncbi:Vps52-domain-containing protein [Pleurostoma richardsiae]|uniref:Vps52-domain-containing protein n=1 Tax=Pleurostoma richardsiae TaxID=41990 RepID=A0AA38VB78_9PEZI|nr:Vps52-domain-containing protein [Pleurostoma richardsiae]
MWLDRLAHTGTSTPPSGSRPISPLPRRTSSKNIPYVTSQRSARASSVSLVSSDSTTSLLASARRLNGSALKQSTTADDGKESLRVLEKLLGTSSQASAQQDGKGPNSVKPEDLNLDFIFDGRSLREVANEAADQASSRIHKPQTAQEYETDKTKFEDLHRSIRACDDVLGSVETNLSNFRNDLATVSADIETLQARSTALNVRLENRKAVEKALGPVVDELSVSPIVVSKISDGHIDESWVKVLAEVDKRATIYNSSSNSSQRQSKAMADLGPLLEKLILKATERIRDFLVAQIKALRSPHINAQIIQQQNFLKFKDAYTFLHKHHATLADEICLAYMNTMRWYYVNQFSRYAKSLEKLKLHVIDKTDVLHDDTSRKTSVMTSSKISGPPHDAFNLGRRIDLLKSHSQVAISSYLAEEDQATHYLEVPFRHFNLALIDNATAEYSFLAGFFSPALSMAVVSRHFNYIFEPTFAVGQGLTKSLVGETYDSLGLLLCIRLNQHFAFELQRRRVPAVEGYINGTNMLLWPRLQVVMDHHCESVRGMTNALPSRPSNSNSGKQGHSAAPHMVTQRFGQLLHGILALSAEAGDDEPVVTSLRRLRSEIEAFLTRYSQAYFPNDKRKGERFLYNNYSLVLTIISDVSGKLATEQLEHFESLKKAFEEAA